MPRRRGRPPRPFEQIVREALAMIDESGVEAFSMRALAQRLGSGTATLYRHVEDREELFDRVVDRVLGEVLDGDAAARKGPARQHDWRPAISAAAWRLYEVLAAHPNVLALLARRVPVGPNALQAREQMLATLLEAGFPPAPAARAYTTVANYVVGFAIQHHGPSATNAPAREQLRSLYEALDGARYPATKALAQRLAEDDAVQELGFGLEALLDGLERTLSRTGDRVRALPVRRR